MRFGYWQVSVTGVLSEKILNDFQLFFKRQPHKMVKHTQAICRQITDGLFECV